MGERCCREWKRDEAAGRRKDLASWRDGELTHVPE